MVEVCGLTKRFGATLAVDDLSFEAPAGQVTGFLGPNGAGKTTTLRMLLGLVEPTNGTATIDGRPYRRLPHPAGRVGAVLETSGFHPGRTARQHLRVHAAAAGLDPGPIEHVLQGVGLGDAADRRVAAFSLGMRQRLGLATALLGDPDVLILDEPANGLDPEGVRALRELLRRLAGEGKAVLLSSHLLAEMAQTVDRVLIVDHGRRITEASLEELTAGAAPTIRVRTPQAERLRVALLADGAGAEMDGPDLVAVTGTTAEAVGDLAARLGIPLFESSVEAANLEDVFFQLTKEA